ncbi:MAG: acyl-CoA dehydrogenase N-terminal domain-containing protein, partial [Roseovarius sp.]
MPSYTAPTRVMQFILHEVLNVSDQDVPGYADL